MGTTFTPWVLLGCCAKAWRGTDTLRLLPEAGLKTAELAKPGLQCRCPSAVHTQESSFPSSDGLAPLLSTKIHLKRNLRERGRKAIGVIYLIFCNGV